MILRVTAETSRLSSRMARLFSSTRRLLPTIECPL